MNATWALSITSEAHSTRLTKRHHRIWIRQQNINWQLRLHQPNILVLFKGLIQCFQSEYLSLWGETVPSVWWHQLGKDLYLSEMGFNCSRRDNEKHFMTQHEPRPASSHARCLSLNALGIWNWRTPVPPRPATSAACRSLWRHVTIKRRKPLEPVSNVCMCVRAPVRINRVWNVSKGA